MTSLDALRPAPIHARAAPAAQPAAGAARRGLHPLIATAAVSVTMASLAAVAAMTGWLPTRQAAPVVAAAAPMPGAALASAGASLPAPTGTPLPGAAAAALPGPAGAALPGPASAALPAPSTAALPSTADAPPSVAPVHRTAPRPVAPRPAASPDAVAAAPAPRPAMRTVAASDLATVESVREVAVAGRPSGLGAIGGGVVGGALGSRIGKGNGRTAMALLGAVGGGLLGHQIEGRMRTERRVEVTYRMDDGSRRTVRYAQDPGVGVGQRLRLGDGVPGPGAEPTTAAQGPMMQVSQPF